MIFNLGDCLSGPLLPLETAHYLMAQGWLSLAGNHERQVLADGPERRSASDEYAHSRLSAKEFNWLQSLPAVARPLPDVLLCHGTPASDVEYFLETVEHGAVRAATQHEITSRLGVEQSQLVACGHTHVPRAVRSSRGQLIVNPGSVGLPAYGDVHPEAHVVETGSPDARYACVERTTSGWVASLLSVPYDHMSMAELARSRGRPEWEHALLSGYMP